MKTAILTIAIALASALSALAQTVMRENSTVYFKTNVYLHDDPTNALHQRLSFEGQEPLWIAASNQVVYYQSSEMTNASIHARYLFSTNAHLIGASITNGTIHAASLSVTNTTDETKNLIVMLAASNTLANVASKGNSYTGEVSVLRVVGPGGNIALGIASINDSSGLFNNTAAGYYAMDGASNIQNSFAGGSEAMKDGIGIGDNIALGSRAMYLSSNSTNSAALGSDAFRSSSGINNAAVGFFALGQSSNIRDSAAFGSSAMRFSKNSGFNIAMGWSTMQYANMASNSFAIGQYAGRNATGRYRGYIDSYGEDPGAAYSPTNDVIFIDNGALHFGRGTNATNIIILRNLPTSDPIVVGQLWRSGSNLYISTGP